MLANDGRVPDAAVAVGELVVGQTDGARIVRGFGLFESAAVERDGSRLIAAGRGKPPVQTPKRGEPARRNRVAERVGRAAEGGGGAVEVVLEQPRFGEHRPDRQLLLSRQRRMQGGT